MTGRDLLLAVDLSGSMEEQDFQLNGQWVDRLDGVEVRRRRRSFNGASATASA